MFIVPDPASDPRAAEYFPLREYSIRMMSGAGKLARLLAVRGGQAGPEAPFVIEHREALIYMLYEAAELAHGITCQHLFAACSLNDVGTEASCSMRSRESGRRS